jgi:hypothetical protein
MHFAAEERGEPKLHTLSPPMHLLNSARPHPAAGPRRLKESAAGLGTRRPVTGMRRTSRCGSGRRRRRAGEESSSMAGWRRRRRDAVDKVRVREDQQCLDLTPGGGELLQRRRVTTTSALPTSSLTSSSTSPITSGCASKGIEAEPHVESARERLASSPPHELLHLLPHLRLRIKGIKKGVRVGELVGRLRRQRREERVGPRRAECICIRTVGDRLFCFANRAILLCEQSHCARGKTPECLSLFSFSCWTQP